MKGITSDLLELIGINEQVDQNEYSAPVTFTNQYTQRAQYLKAIMLLSRESGAGAVLRPNGNLMLFSADPANAAGAATIAAAKWDNLLTCGWCSRRSPRL